MRQDDGLFLVAFQPVKQCIVGTIEGLPTPAADLSKSVDNPAQLGTDAPASFVFALFAYLLCATSFAHWKQHSIG